MHRAAHNHCAGRRRACASRASPNKYVSCLRRILALPAAGLRQPHRSVRVLRRSWPRGELKRVHKAFKCKLRDGSKHNRRSNTIAQKRLDVTKHMLWRLKIPNSPNLSKEALLKELQTRNILSGSVGRGKTADVSFWLQKRSPAEHVSGGSHRQGDALLPGKVCVSMIKQRLKGRGRPKLTDASVVCMESLSERGSKMLEQEDSYKNLWRLFQRSEKQVPGCSQSQPTLLLTNGDYSFSKHRATVGGPENATPGPSLFVLRDCGPRHP